MSSTIPISDTHPDAQKYRLDYKNNKDELCKKLYKLYNEKVFDNQLPQDILIEWNNRMRGTAGYCYNKKSIRTLSGVVKSSRIVLATKVTLYFFFYVHDYNQLDIINIRGINIFYRLWIHQID